MRINFTTLSACALPLLILAACNPLREISNISVSVTSETEVQGTIVEMPAFPGFEGFDISQTETFQNSDATRDNLESSSLDSFTLRVTEDSQGQSLGFIDEMKVFINAEGQDEQLIAWYDEFEEGQREASFNVVDDVDLTDYFRQDEAEIVTETTSSAPQQNTTLEAEMVFDINFLL